MRAMWFAAALMTVAASPALAQNAEFSVGAVKLTAPLPDGFCLPEGDQVARATAIAAFDDYNLTALTLMSCGEAADPLSTIVVKVSRIRVARPVTLRQTLANAEFDLGVSPGHALDDDLARVAERETGIKTEVTHALAGLGRDDLCGYIGGTVESMSMVVSLVVCVTVVGQRELQIIISAPGGDPAEIPRLRAQARAFAATITAD